MENHRPSEVFDEDLAENEELITDEQALQALKEGVGSIVEVWKEQQLEKANLFDPTGRNRIEFEVKWAALNYRAGKIKEAIEALNAADALAFKNRDMEMTNEIESLRKTFK